MLSELQSYISKSDYLAGLQCHKLLWHRFNGKDQIPCPDDNVRAVLEQGHQVGVRLPSEEDALLELQHLSPEDAERLAREQGLRAPSPDVARQKLAETVVTLREIERIAGAGKPQH